VGVSRRPPLPQAVLRPNPEGSSRQRRHAVRSAPGKAAGAGAGAGPAAAAPAGWRLGRRLCVWSAKVACASGLASGAEC